MSILFQRKLEFTLIFTLLLFSSFTVNSVIYAQKIDNADKVKELSELISNLEDKQHPISQDSLELSKDFVININNGSYNSADPSIIDELFKAHSALLNALLVEARNSTELQSTKNTIAEQQQLYEKLSKYNTDISQDLKKY
ncbi:MAG TPA: hypothetical protein VLB82_03170 [Thermodesulfobacteriota bacterium]|nr:hypothetical protein [Thermodesulfobacteriota bacterium]